MQELGVEEQEAQATLMSVESQVSRSLPEVWRVFSTEVHEQRALSGHKESIRRQTMEMLADMRARGTDPTRPPDEIERMTTKAKRQWLSGVKKERDAISRLRKAWRGTLYPHLVDTAGARPGGVVEVTTPVRWRGDPS
jgi:hypothetical protein